MRIDILTLFPEIFEGPMTESIIKRAQEKSMVEIHLHNIRAYSNNKQKSVDDYQFGGGAGMVMTIQPIADLIDQLQEQRHYDEIIYTTPDGNTYNQAEANTLSLKGNLMILCGRYKGVDQRIRDKYITKEISIGDYVLTGGELAAAIIVDSIVRLIPGVIGDEASALSDSFQDQLLAPPVFTRPAEYEGMKVPEVLLNGNFKLIDEWRHEQSIKKTQERRPDLLEE